MKRKVLILVVCIMFVLSADCYKSVEEIPEQQLKEYNPILDSKEISLDYEVRLGEVVTSSLAGSIGGMSLPSVQFIRDNMDLYFNIPECNDFYARIQLKELFNLEVLNSERMRLYKLLSSEGVQINLRGNIVDGGQDVLVPDKYLSLEEWINTLNLEVISDLILKFDKEIPGVLEQLGFIGLIPESLPEYD